MLIPFVDFQWRPPVQLEVTSVVEPGSRSTERETQLERERHILQTIYFTRESIPFTPEEPDVENFAKEEPVQIPIKGVRLTLLKELCVVSLSLQRNSLFYYFPQNNKVTSIHFQKVVTIIKLTNFSCARYLTPNPLLFEREKLSDLV